MNLKELVSVIAEAEIFGSQDVEISGISLDSRSVRKGHLFAALPGIETHGKNFVAEAEAAGAAAILSDAKLETALPLIVAKNARLQLAVISNHFYGYPSQSLHLTGVTGTNGKTTVAFLIQAMYQAAGRPCGLIGTIHYSGQSFSRTATHTTPESPDLQRLLRRLVQEGSSACAMEVSSQGLDQYRVAGSTFETAIFTNLTHEHLDYHKNMENYFHSKMMLFDNHTCTTRSAVTNWDDAYGKRLHQMRLDAGLQSVTYGFEKGAEFLFKDWTTSTRGSRMTIVHAGKEHRIKTALVGQYNLYNIGSAFAAAVLLGLPVKAIKSGIKKMSYVPGRMEEIDFGQSFKIIIDYAHTDDAFRQLLPTLRLYTSNRIIHIFGCRGGKDKTKRPIMGKVAGELGDIVVLSSDNPKNEDPAKIAEQVKTGLQASGNPNYHVVLDRAEAIAFAVGMAEPGDTIVITGKGNETYQLIGNRKYPFDERELFLAAVQSKQRS